MRRSVLMLSFVLSACATDSGEKGRMLIETASQGQPLPGAVCTVMTSSGTMSVTTPATVSVANTYGDLHITCDRPGYRTSEFVFRPSASQSGSSMGVGLGGGGGHVGVGVGLNFPISRGTDDYPSHVTVNMNPQ
jgi:hypothetical protein